MAVDQSAVPKDLRPLNPNRPAIPNSSSDPLLASSAAAAHHSAVHFHSATVPNGNPHQPWPYAHHGAPNGVHDSAAALPPEDLSVSEDHQTSAGKKVKFLCSFGGKILPRVQDGALRYVGGHTRIIAIRKDASFAGLMQKMVEVQGGPVVLKYQLPDEDLDALVTVSCTEDLENMMEEYDKLSEVLQDGSAKLRVFLFSPAEFDPSLGFSSQMSEGQDSGQRYVDALNGIPESGSLRRKDSMASAASTQNSDGAAGVDFTVENAASEGMLPSSTASPAAQDAPKLAGLGGMPSLSAVPVSVQGGLVPPPHQNVAPMRPELSPPSLQAYVPQAYPDSHQEAFNYMNMNIFPGASHYQYINPQQLGLGGAPVGYVAVPQNAYLPGMQITTAPPPPSAHVTTSRPMTSRAEHYLEENTYGGRAADPSNKPYQVPPQLPPLPPSTLQSMNLDRYGGAYAWPQAPLQPYTQQGHSTRLDESVLSQKPLPHAHSDPPVQDHRTGVISSTDLEKNPVFQSLQLEEAMHFHAQHKVVNPIVTDGVKDPKVETTMVASQNDSERVAPQRSENFDNNRHIFPPGISGFPSDLRTIYNMHPSHHCQAPAGEALHYQQPSQMGMHQYPAMQDLFTNKVACVDTTSARSEIIHTYEPVSRDAGPLSFSHVKPIEGMLEGLCVNPESSGIYEMPKVVNKPDVSPPKSMVTGSTTLVTESRENTKLFEEKDLLSGSPLVTTGDPAEGISIKPVEHLPPSTLDVTYTNNIQPTGQVPPFMGNPGLYTHHVGSGGEPPIPNKRLLGVPNNKIPVVDRREQASSFPSTNVHNDASIPPCGNFPLSSSNTVRSKDNFGEIRNPVQRDSFLVDPDPWGVKQNAEILPSKPKRISSGESLVSKDASLENHVTYSGDAHPSAHLEKGNNQKPSDLNRDSFLDLMQPMKDVTDEKIKKEIPVVSDGMISPVIQPSVPTSTGISFLQANEYVPESGSGRIQDDNQGLQNTLFSYDDCKPQDVKAKDKLNHGFHITEDIERLQIIKNNDLEELRELGSGTFGTVYHGKWRGTDVAIKRINDRCFAGKPSDQERMRQDFWNEACNLADLHHPNVVAFYGVVLDGPGGSIATVTEYMVNGSLRNALQKNDKALDMRKRLLIAMDVAFGMEYLHGKKIVHFDLKSDNLLVNLRDPQRPICKVGDLGLSKVKCQTLISGGVRGTLPWMAPELLNGCSSLVSEKVDVFSFGIVMWELLTGEEPYADLHYGAIIGGIVNNTLRPQVPDYCDPEWRSLMEICWSAEPSERPSFTEIAGRLRSLAASISQRGQSHSNPTASLQTQK